MNDAWTIKYLSIYLSIYHVSEYVYLEVRIIKDGHHEPEINDRINKGRAAISNLNSIVWDRDVTSKTRTHIYHSIVKSTITYAAETWYLKVQSHMQQKHGI